GRQTTCRIDIDIADQDAEAIAVQMTGLELVGVLADAQDVDAVAVELRQLALDADWHRHHLARDGVAILEAGRADFRRSDAETTRNLTREELGAHVAFLDPEI